jgi:hypothetical protein
MAGYQGHGWQESRLLQFLQQSLSRSAITHLVANDYSCRAFRANGPLPQTEEKPDSNGLMSFFNLLPVFTDVDLSLLDPTSYFSRCVCSGFFLPEIKRGAISAP